ncbi:4-carboxy-4-hydroxy-2-oxoadipate aldolase/oxaloacetate decarboxylase [Aureimonas sp. OT7]|mgnify:CR=1 FL=1|uniref:4-carboxy-4-hydroxy-2-oxoadipate aldolase/oxaloacetate decarboxylase n=1 Tax=Aureimonas TaxID=414371 RepID=UPI00177E89F1|nr:MULTISPECIES: 4-carboxy-4-hydroxy-2-oxoadipate aldolase/oxaloacetate decarboxylase [Aureimonas]QOG07301.1 4-carboxy-4-hydroxy-2-oxoadipate aldolase/oxaloacetate decarboxylase [Aureimonas sp. OT7]
MTIIRRSFTRPDPEIVAAVGKYSTATIHEAQGRLGAVDSAIKPIKPDVHVFGTAITAQCHIGDNLMIFEAINCAQPGDILVLSAGNNPQQGGFGDVLASACMGRGIKALIIDAGVRDGRGLRKSGFPVFCLGLSIKGTSKETLGSVNQPVVIGGELISPGDIVVADDDGVVVVRKDPVELAAACQRREDAEAAMIESHMRGVLTFDERYESIRNKGATYVD